MLLNRNLPADNRYFSLLFFSLIVLLYFSFTVETRGDEGLYYQGAFAQAYARWPGLDWSPTWSLSSQYLWILSSAHAVFGSLFSTDMITSGRLLSVICWTVLAFLLLKEEKGVRWKALLVLFNPYLLVYVTRAHPLVPAILLVYLFWKGIQHHNRIWGLYLLVAVMFQVFTGGVAAMLLPASLKNIRWNSLRRPVLAGVFAVCGVLLTWLGWGGMYPEAFVNHSFFQEYHVNGTPSLGYVPMAFMVTGGAMWMAGDRPVCEMFSQKIGWFSLLLVIGAVILYFGKPVTGIVNTFSSGFLPDPYAKGALTLFFAFMGVGWLRVKRDRFMLCAGVLGCAVLMAVLPYLYERIAFFGCLAPSLLWILSGKGEKADTLLITLACLVFLCFAGIYEVMGVL